MSDGGPDSRFGSRLWLEFVSWPVAVASMLVLSSPWSREPRAVAKGRTKLGEFPGFKIPPVEGCKAIISRSPEPTETRVLASVHYELGTYILVEQDHLPGKRPLCVLVGCGKESYYAIGCALSYVQMNALLIAGFPNNPVCRKWPVLRSWLMLKEPARTYLSGLFG